MDNRQSSYWKHHYNISAIRELLTDAFSAEELRRLCWEQSLFRPVYEKFTDTIPKDSMIDYLLEFCERQLFLNELLFEVQRRAPRQYKQYKEQLYKKPIGVEKARKLISQLIATISNGVYSILKKANWHYFIVIIMVISIIIVIRPGIKGDHASPIILPNYDCSQTEPLKQDKFGIVIADFGEGSNKVEAERGKDIAEMLYRDLSIKVQEAGLSNVEVIKLGTVIRDENEAKNISTQHRTSIVVWGWASSHDNIFFPNFTSTVSLSEVVEYGELQRYFNPVIQLEAKDLTDNLSIRTTAYTTFVIGLVYMSNCNYQAAIREFSKVIKLVEPDDQKLGTDVFYNYRGKAYLSHNLSDEALADFERAIAVNPNYVSAYVGLGNVYFQRGNWERAANFYEQALNHDRDYYLAIFGLGNVNYMQGNFSEAVSLYEETIKAKKDFALGHFHLALAYYFLKNHDRSIEAFNETIRQADSEGNEELKNAALRNLEAIAKLTTPIVTSTNIGTPVLSDILLPAPKLVEPPSQWAFIGTFTHLTWKWDRTLAPNEYFVIKLRRGETSGVIFSHRTKATEYKLNIREIVGQDFENHVYYWSIQVISVGPQVNEYVFDNFVSHESELRPMSHVDIATKLCLCYY